MLNMNRATLLGHAGRDPEIRDLKNGDKAAVFTLATTEKWKAPGRRSGRGHGMAPDRGLRPGRRGGRHDGAQGPRGAGRGPDREPQLQGQRGQGPADNRDRGRRAARRGQHTFGAFPGGGGFSRTGRAEMNRIASFVLAALLLGRPSGRHGLGAVLHRAVRQPDLGRVLGVPVPDLDRAALHRQRLGRAGHSQPVPRRSASAARPFRASASRSGSGSRPG